MPLASSKQLFGNGLGKSVTGALMARMPAGSSTAGRTASPFAIDQSLIVCTSLSFSRSSSRDGGYDPPVREDIVRGFSGSKVSKKKLFGIEKAKTLSS